MPGAPPPSRSRSPMPARIPSSLAPANPRQRGCRSGRSTPIARATGCPRERVLEPIVAPEELVADHGCRRAEDAEGDRPLRLGAETRLRLGRPGGFDQRAARVAERIEDGGDRLAARDVAVIDE